MVEKRSRPCAMTLADLIALHAGAIVGLGITEAQLNKW